MLRYRLYNVQVKKKKEKKNSITLLATIESIYRKNNILLLEIYETPIFLHSKTTREIKTKYKKTVLESKLKFDD